MNKTHTDLTLRTQEYRQLLEYAELIQMDEGTVQSLKADIEEWEQLAKVYEKAIDCICGGKNNGCGMCGGFGVVSSNVKNL